MEPKFNIQNMRDTRTEILDNIRAIRGDIYCDCLSAMVSLLTKADVIQYELLSHSADPDASKELCTLLAIAISGGSETLRHGGRRSFS